MLGQNFLYEPDERDQKKTEHGRISSTAVAFAVIDKFENYYNSQIDIITAKL